MVGTVFGFTLARGEIACSTLLGGASEELSIGPCAIIHRHDLQVSIAGAASATLAPGAAAIVGDYHVTHGLTDSHTRLTGERALRNTACADLTGGPSQFAAVLRPEAF